MQDLSCFSCKSTLANAAPVCNDNFWTVACRSCGVVNKLTPVPDRAGHFSVSGAFFVVEKEPQN